MAAKIPATVVTGFLGAGKTSLIQNLLRNAKGRRLALIINEFGDIGIDGEIVKGCRIEGCPEENIVELANGCICCTVADDFLPTMRTLLDRPFPPEHIVIETSGLALPKPLVKAFNWPEVRTRVTVDGVIAVVDGPAVAEGRFADEPSLNRNGSTMEALASHESPLAELFEDQINCADLIVLNKIDQMDAAQRLAAEAAIRRELRRRPRILPASHGDIASEILLGLGAAAEDDLHSRPSHHELEGEDHDHDEFESFHLTLSRQASPEDLLGRLKPLVDRHDILRVKGFLDVEGRDMRLVVQGVGDRIQHYTIARGKRARRAKAGWW
jgi:cobalamin biosynthesis protein CobW